MTANQLLEYLNIGRAKFTILMKNHKIPGNKIGGSWRFYKPIIDQWLRDTTIRTPQDELRLMGYIQRNSALSNGKLVNVK